MLRTPDGHGRIELAMFRTPKAISAELRTAKSESDHVMALSDSWG